MKKRRLRIYLDTSVFGGPFDTEWAEDSARLFAEIKRGQFQVVTSEVVAQEIEQAPSEVVKLFESIRKKEIEEVEITIAAVQLHRAYLDAGFLRKKSQADALHVALATVHGVDAIVSWNFRDIVRLDHIKAFNDINVLGGFQKLTIITPKEAVIYEKK